MNIERLLMAEEGLRLKPYRCSEKKLTIGYGRNLEANGISEAEAIVMLRNDIWAACSFAASLPDLNFIRLSQARQAVIVSMIFQMGTVGFGKFKNTIRLIKEEKFEEAANQMLKSLWAKQTPERTKRHAEMMRTGEWLDYYK